jgi:hypothetical protein
MKKILLFFIILNYSFALEPYLELTTDYRLQNYGEDYFYYKAIGGIKHRGDFYDIELSAIAEEGADPTVDLYRGYIDFHHEDYSLSIGRQSINWGNAFVFNLSNSLYIGELLDPKAERNGVDSVYFKYSSPNLSRAEFVYFRSDNKYDNFATRYTFLINNFEFMANYFYLKQDSPETNRLEHDNKFVLEAKGDIGIGIWAQLGYDNFESKDFVTGVFGMDYNFDFFERSIYTVLETEYNEYITGLVLSYNFSITEDIEFRQSYTLINDDWFISNLVTYTYNDYLEFQGIYNYFDYKERSKFYTHNKNEPLNNEIIFRVTLYL